MKVENIESAKGNKIANQFNIRDNGKTYFQSYDSLCAVLDGDKLTLGQDWDYSVTTLKYLYIWLSDYCYPIWREVQAINGKSGADRIRKAIEQGLIIYDEKMV